LNGDAPNMVLADLEPIVRRKSFDIESTPLTVVKRDPIGIRGHVRVSTRTKAALAAARARGTVRCKTRQKPIVLIMLRAC
jgi:hypothetical protein